MAAPSATVWGNIVTESTSAAKIGIYTALSSSSTQTTVTIQVWIASKWSLLDSNYTFYFNNNAISATTLISDDVLPKIDVKVATGTGWSDSNQVKLYTYTVTYNRGTSAKKVNCAAKLTDINRFSGKTMTVSSSYTIPALTSYTVSYVANGGSGAPSAQVKWHGKTLTLSTTKPTRTGYTFLGWSTSTTATSATYTAGASFTANANTNLYAVWKANTYTVSYNANGGSGAPSNQTKTYGTALTLSSTKPTRTNYTFKGWGTSASSTTVAYAAGASYTANAAITLYAIWTLAYSKPRINGLAVTRCTSNGTVSDEGTYFKVTFDWVTDKTVSSIVVAWGSTSSTISASGTSGSVSTILGSGNVSAESNYTVKITVSDSDGSTIVSRSLPGRAYSIDILAGGKGVAIGKPATNRCFDVNMDTYINGVKVTGNTLTTKGSNTIATTDDDIPANWVAQGNSVHWHTVSDILVDQPNQYGLILNIAQGTNVHQLWMTQRSGSLFHRGGNEALGWPTTVWREVLDSVNYSDYALPLAGGTVTGFTKFNHGTNTLGWFRLHNEWIGFYGSAADAQAHTNRKAYISLDPNTSNFYITNSAGGSYIVTKAWTVSSDKRLKTDINDVSGALVNVWKELLPKTFKWIDPSSGNETYLGLIAQDVISAFEKYGLDYRDYGFVVPYKSIDDDTEYFGITYDSYHMLTAMVLRETNEKLEDQQKQIDSLKQQFEELRRSLYDNQENAD